MLSGDSKKHLKHHSVPVSCMKIEEDILISDITFCMLPFLKVVPRIAPPEIASVQGVVLSCFPCFLLERTKIKRIPESPKANCRSYIIPGIVPVSELFLADPPFF